MPAEQTSPGLRERKKLETRRTIRSVALRLFEQEGFDAVGVERIAHEANVSRATLFNYFASKQSIVFDTDPFVMDRWQAILVGQRTDGTLWATLETALVVYLETFGDLLVTVHRLKLASPTLMASSRDVTDQFWADLTAWAKRHRPTDDPCTQAFTLAAARGVFFTAFELWDADEGIEACIAVMRRGFAEAGAGFARAAS